jgi:hypothetical protein
MPEVITVKLPVLADDGTPSATNVYDAKMSEECATCEHRRVGTTCKAFPQGIPAPILNGEVSHKQPYAGDGGTQWKLQQLQY